MGAPATAPRRAPAPRPAPRRRRRRPDRALASQRPRRAAGGARASRGRPGSAARVIQPAMAGAAMLPQAAVRTAGAVRDISDSGAIVRLTRGRGWIALLCALLGGIVALNVIGLNISTGVGRTGAAIEELERRNSALRAELAEQLSASRVEGAAAQLGLAVPDPRDVRYLDAHDSDAEKLEKLVGTDAFLNREPADYAPELYEPGSYEDPAPAATAAPAPAPAPPPPEPAAPAPAPSGGGSSGGSGGIGL
jgi:hypothetical protein